MRGGSDNMAGFFNNLLDYGDLEWE